MQTIFKMFLIFAKLFPPENILEVIEMKRYFVFKKFFSLSRIRTLRQFNLRSYQEKSKQGIKKKLNTHVEKIQF